MISLCFSVYDGAVKAFLPPFFCRTQGEALRSFSEAVNDAKHQFNRHASDYTLFLLGEYDDSSGVIAAVSAPQRVRSALECIVDDDIFPADKRLPM
jgi:hypothetical protein